jgi:hypothetical protein
MQDGLAVRISAGYKWMVFGSAVSGRLEPGFCSYLKLNFISGSLAAGQYTGQITIGNNDPAHNPVTIPLTFIVGQLNPPDQLTLYYLAATGQLEFRMGGAKTLVGQTTGTTLTITAPTTGKLFYEVVATDGVSSISAPAFPEHTEIVR